MMRAIGKASSRVAKPSSQAGFPCRVLCTMWITRSGGAPAARRAATIS